MVTRIYLWKPTSLKSFGHISMELSDKTYVSWWPVEKMKSFSQAMAGSSAKPLDSFEEELKENGSPDKTFYLTGLNEDNIKAYMKGLLDGSVRWDLRTRSCSNIIYRALCEGSEWFKDRAGDTTTPNSVAGLVEAYVDGKKDKKIVLDGTYISWWPVKESSVKEKIVGTRASWFETFQSELQESGNPDKTFNLSELNEDNTKAYFKRLLDGSVKYDLLKRSCSNVIYKALCEGADWFKGRAGQTTTPEAVAALVEAYLENKTDKKIKVASFCK